MSCCTLYRDGGARTATERMSAVARYYDISSKAYHGDIFIVNDQKSSYRTPLPQVFIQYSGKINKNKTSTGIDISQQHSSNDFINYFTSKINTIRDQTVTMQLPAAVSHQIVHYRSPEEQFHSFSTIGEEEFYKLVKSAKPTTSTVC